MLQKRRINCFLNIVIVLLLVAVTISGAIFFIRSSQPSKPARRAAVSKVEKHSAANQQEKSATSAADQATATPEQGTNTSQSNSAQQSNNEQSEATSRSDGVVVDNGMDFYYRAAIALGLIPEETPIMDFYDHCQYSDDGSFTYNGQTYNTEVIQDGHQDEYHCNILVTPAN